MKHRISIRNYELSINILKSRNKSRSRKPYTIKTPINTAQFEVTTDDS